MRVGVENKGPAREKLNSEWLDIPSTDRLKLIRIGHDNIDSKVHSLLLEVYIETRDLCTGYSCFHGYSLVVSGEILFQNTEIRTLARYRTIQSIPIDKH